MKRERKRRMKPYHPRRRRTAKEMDKQKLLDIEHKISADIGDYIVLIEEGSKEQMELARQKARSDFLKFAPEMQKIAEQMGGSFAKEVETYLNSVSKVIDASTEWVDESLLSNCYKATSQLENDLRKTA